MTATQSPPPPDTKPPHIAKYKHGRAASELTLRSTMSGHASAAAEDASQRKPVPFRTRSYSTASTSSGYGETMFSDESTVRDDDDLDPS
jgi:hypothetical protein